VRPFDWTLFIVAIAAIATGVYINQPVCIPDLRPGGSLGCLEWRFPFGIAIGVVIAALAVAVLAIRISRRRAH